MNLLALQTLWWCHQSPPEQPTHRHQHHHGEQLLAEHEELPERSRQNRLIAERRPHTVQQDFSGARGQNQKSPEDRRVRQSCAALAQDLGLREPDREQVPRPSSGMVEPVLGLAESQVADQPLNVVAEEAQRGGEDDQERDVLASHDQPCARAAFTAAVSAGTISNASPTIP